MSGPKVSRYEIERRKIEELERKRKLRVKNELSFLLSQLEIKIKKYSFIDEQKKMRVRGWIKEAIKLNERLLEFKARSQIKGIENYLIKLDSLELRVKKIEEQKQQRKDELEIKKGKIQITFEVIREELKNLDKIKFGQHVKEWFRDAESNFNRNDLFKAEKGINGINNFLNKNKTIIENKTNEIELRESYINQLSLIQSYKEISSKGIEQRLELFSNILNKSNGIFNTNDLQQFNQFIEQVEKIKLEFDNKDEEKEYVKSVIEDSFDSKNSKTINGVPIKINFEQDDGESKIIFDIDDSKSSSSSCMEVLDKLNKNLSKNSISIGDIYVRKTGKTIRLKSSDSISEQIRVRN